MLKKSKSINHKVHKAGTKYTKGKTWYLSRKLSGLCVLREFLWALPTLRLGSSLHFTSICG